VLAITMFFVLASLIGLPLGAGFTAKVNLLWVLVLNGGWWWALIIVIGLNTIISAFYYFRIIRAMYLESSDEPGFFGNPVGVGLGAACAGVLVLLFLGWGPLYKLTENYGRLYLTHQPATPAAQTAMATP
jgi:NADH-quinone oxidoreductase subunit N